MDEQNSTEQHQDAIDINDFVFAATGARVRRLTMPDGTHWFPAVDVCKNLGYMHVGSALRNVADTVNFASAESVLQRHTLDIPAGREWRRDMNLVNLEGLIRLVNGCTKPESQPFKVWVSEVIATIQRDGSYSLEPAVVQPAPAGCTAYVMPQQVADALVGLEQRSIRTDDLLRQINNSQTAIVEVLRDIAQTLRRPVPARPGTGVDARATPDQLEDQEPGRHRGHPQGGRPSGAGTAAWRGRLQRGGDRRVHRADARPCPRLLGVAVRARVRPAGGPGSGRRTVLRAAVAR